MTPGMYPPPTIFTFFQPFWEYWGSTRSGALLPPPVGPDAQEITGISKTNAISAAAKLLHLFFIKNSIRKFITIITIRVNIFEKRDIGKFQ
jgi:hypothetical protein